MITRIVKLTLVPEFLDGFMDYFEGVKSGIRSSPGCRRLELLQSPSDRRLLFTLSQWDSEGDLENYLRSDRFRTTWTHVKPMFASGAEAWTLERLMEVLPASAN